MKATFFDHAVDQHQSSYILPRMSFGFSISDITALTGLAWRTVQNCRKAGSQHQELTDQVSSVHLVLKRFEREMLAPTSTIQQIDDTYREEIGKILGRCQNPLRLMGKLLERYNGLGKEGNNFRDLYRRVRFSNGEVVDLQELRTILTQQTNALTLYLNIILLGASGRVERQLNESGKELREMKAAVNGIAASLVKKASKEGSVLTAYTQDDGEVWRDFRRGMISKGFKSSFLQRHESLIRAYVEELSNRGALDDPVLTGTASENAHPCNDNVEVANSYPEPGVNRGKPQVGSLRSRKGHTGLDSRGKDGKHVKERAVKNTPADHKASIGSDKYIHDQAPGSSSSRPEKASRLQSMDQKESPLAIWSIPNPEEETVPSWAEEDLSMLGENGKLFLQVLHYRRTHAVSLSPFFTEPPYSFFLKIEKRELLECGNSLSLARIPLQVAMNAPWAKPDFWLYPSSTGETLQNWQRWERAHGPAVERTYVESSQKSESFFLACPWGICLIFCGYNISLLFADLEFVSRVVAHAQRQYLYCMDPEHRLRWVSLNSNEDSLTRFLWRSRERHVPTMKSLIREVVGFLTTEEDVSPWTAIYFAEGEGPPTIEDVHGLACLSFVAKVLTTNSSTFNYPDFKALMDKIADRLEKYTRGNGLARLVDLCVDVDRAHVQEKHSTTMPCRIKQ